MKKRLLLALGWLSLGIGILGIFLPVLPTVPFILLASYLFYYSSEKAYVWLTTHRVLGPPLRQYHRYLAIPKRSKIIATIMLWFSLIASMVIFRRPITYYILPVIGIIGSYIIYRIPSLTNEQLAEWEEITKKIPESQ